MSQGINLFLNELMMLANQPGQLVAGPQPQVPLVQRPPQRNEAGFCYSCNSQAMITPQKRCAFCASDFVEVDEIANAQARPVVVPAAFHGQNAGPLPRMLAPVLPAHTPPPTLVPAAAPQIAAVVAPPATAALAAVVPPVRQKRTYTRRNQVNQAAPPPPPVNLPAPAQTSGTATATGTLTAAQHQVNQTKSPAKTSRARKRPIKEVEGLNAGESFKENSPRKNQDYECRICFEVQSDCVFLGCQHMCACYKCGLNIHQMTGQCPICRKAIDKVLRVYRA